MNWFAQKLEKTRRILNTPIEDLFTGRASLDSGLLERLEETLIASDVGVPTAMHLMEGLEDLVQSRKIADAKALKSALAQRMKETLAPCAAGAFKPSASPHVIMVAGVNGVGKTTTIGKLAALFRKQGFDPMLVAADTFRAAAVEQLDIWAGRAGVDIVKHMGTSDPAAVVFDGLEAARARKRGVVLIDTAGRLHTKVNLMEELKKIRRTAAKKIPGAPHDTWLVLDASTGQNAVSQARLFHEAVGVTGLILTKLDGTAKGGVVLAICHELGLPVLFVGLGEQVDDLKGFDPDAFVDALL
jgi:fused signal recognition particle receptor